MNKAPMQSAWAKLRQGSRPVGKSPLRWRRIYDKTGDHTPPVTTPRPKAKKKQRQKLSAFTFTTRYEIPLDANGDLTATNSKGQVVTFPRKFFAKAGHIVPFDDYCILTQAKPGASLAEQELSKAKSQYDSLLKTLERLVTIAMARSRKLEGNPKYAASVPKSHKTIKVVRRWKVSS